MLIHHSGFEEAGVARVEDVDLTHHLAHYHLEVLIVDFHTLEAVNVLHLVHDIVLHGRGALDAQDVGRSDGTVAKCCSGAHIVAFLNQDLLAERYQIFLHLAQSAGYLHLAVTALDFTEGHLTVDFAHDSGVRRVAGLEELGDTRQTAGDVTCAARSGTRNLHKGFACADFLAFVVHQVRAHRQRISLNELTILVEELGFGDASAVFRLDNDFLAVARCLVVFVAVGDTLDEVIELERTVHLAHDNGVERVPLTDHVALLNHVATLEMELGTVVDATAGKHHLGLGVHDLHFGHATYHHVHAVFVLNGAQFIDDNLTVVLRREIAHGGDVAFHTTHVERTQSKLSTRLTD